MVDYTLIRTGRKTLAIYIRDGVVEVRAPYKLSESEIIRFVAEKEQWINSKLAIANQREQQRSQFTLDYGDTVIYLDKPYPIVARRGDQIGFDNQQFYMPEGLNSEQIKQASILIYRMIAKRDLTNKAISFGDMMGVMPTAVKINAAKTRWGSCSAKHNLNFSWRLIMAPEEVVDYVVVHELAHITELNHSERFWQIVQSVLPDYRQRQAQLKQLQARLSTENWD